MRIPRLETLWLDERDMEAARKEIEALAFCKWQEAGCPDNSALDFWLEAEIEWIEYCYVPDRYPA